MAAILRVCSDRHGCAALTAGQLHALGAAGNSDGHLRHLEVGESALSKDQKCTKIDITHMPPADTVAITRVRMSQWPQLQESTTELQLRSCAFLWAPSTPNFHTSGACEMLNVNKHLRSLSVEDCAIEWQGRVSQRRPLVIVASEQARTISVRACVPHDAPQTLFIDTRACCNLTKLEVHAGVAVEAIGHTSPTLEDITISKCDDVQEPGPYCRLLATCSKLKRLAFVGERLTTALVDSVSTCGIAVATLDLSGVGCAAGIAPLVTSLDAETVQLSIYMVCKVDAKLAAEGFDTRDAAISYICDAVARSGSVHTACLTSAACGRQAGAEQLAAGLRHVGCRVD